MLETLLQPGDKEERCGIILKDGTIKELPNVADEPHLGFKMSPKALLPLLEDVAATWHTHPDTDPNLSGEDYVGFLSWPDWQHHVIGLREGKVVVETYRVENGLVIGCD